MATVTYCHRWNPVLKAPAEIVTADEAARLHRERKPYCVVVEADDLAVVEMCFFQAYCHVLFLDEKKRAANRYSFVETGDGRLFLEEAAVHYYPGDDDRPSHGEIFRFKPDGGLSHDTGRAGGPITRKEGRTDVRRNYASVPEFGKYDSILLRERER
jgi:hypothetical protein